MQWISRCVAALALLGTTGPLGAQVTPPSAPAEPAPAPRRALTLQDAIALARRNNPGLRIVEESRQQAEDRVREVRATRYPQVGASASFAVQGPPAEFITRQPGQPPQSTELVPSTAREFGATATLNTDLAGRIRAQQRSARLGADAATSEVRASENDLVYEITNAYAGVLRGEELVRVAQEAVGASREQLRVAEAGFRAGVVPQFDVLRASVTVENLRQDQIGVENSARQAEARLIALLNIDPATRLELAPLVPQPGPTPPAVPAGESPPATLRDRPAERSVGGAKSASHFSPAAGEVRLVAAPSPPAAPPITPEPRILGEDVTPDLRAALDTAYRQRPEILAAQQNLGSAEEQIRFERRARNPDLAIQGAYTYNPDIAGFNTEKENYRVAGVFTLSVFDGGLIRARTRQAENAADTARISLERVRQTVALDVRTALLNQREAEARRRTATANVAQAREARRIAQVRYQAGVSTNVEVTDAEVALIRAQTNLVNADYDLIVAQAALQRALGGTEPAVGTGK